MTEPTTAQSYHLILADIAMAAAIASGGDKVLPEDRLDYTPGAIRDRWMARTPDGPGKRQALAMANAGVAALQSMPAERLIATAQKLGVPLDATAADRIASHFDMKREALLKYNR